MTHVLAWREVFMTLPSGERVSLHINVAVEAETDATVRDMVERMARTALTESMRDVAFNAIRTAYPEAR